MSSFKPRTGEVIMAVVSLRGALDNIALTLASTQNIDLSLPERSPLPHWVDPRPLVYVGEVPGGHTAIPLATFNQVPPEAWDLLLQNIVIPIGEAASALPFFQGKISFDTYPQWTHRDRRPAYIVPQQIFIPATVPMHPSTGYRSMSARTAKRLIEYCREVLLTLAELSKEEAEIVLDSYTQAKYGRPLYPALAEPQDTESPSPTAQDVPSHPDQDAAPLAIPVASSTPIASPPVALNPLATPFTPKLHPSSGGVDLLDLVSRLSLVTGASSVAQHSILSVLQDNAPLLAGDAAPHSKPQRKVRRAHTDDIAEKENRAA